MATMTRPMPVPGRPDFWKVAKRRTVTWQLDDKRLNTLIAECRFPGIYALVSGKRVLKVGQTNHIGKRLLLHVTLGNGHPPGWIEFTQVLRGRKLTIYFLHYDEPEHLRVAVEIAAMNSRSPLWEELKRAGATREKPRELVNPGAVARGVVKELGKAVPSA
jgi:hypothetical protein